MSSSTSSTGASSVPLDCPQFTYRPALPPEHGVTRRDPSPVIAVKGRYHVWYSRSTEGPTGYHATIWHASSPDGLVWTEHDEALGTGPAGAFDEHAVFTPTLLVDEGKLFMFYTAVPEPFTNDNGGPRGTPTAIGLAQADSPDGPWRRTGSEPVLRPSLDPDAFDSHRIDDACVIAREGGYWMYYKGRQQDHSPGETKMGVAIAPKPTGPYHKHEASPVVPSGHEVCVWPQNGGVAALISPVGPQGSTLQYSEDGLHFQAVHKIKPPMAPGPYRPDFDQPPRPGELSWGISHKAQIDWPYLVRFDVTWDTP